MMAAHQQASGADSKRVLWSGLSWWSFVGRVGATAGAKTTVRISSGPSEAEDGAGWQRASIAIDPIDDLQ
jgi:hypothetical protein